MNFNEKEEKEYWDTAWNKGAEFERRKNKEKVVKLKKKVEEYKCYPCGNRLYVKLEHINKVIKEVFE